jgi:hypothetical protein
MASACPLLDRLLAMNIPMILLTGYAQLRDKYASGDQAGTLLGRANSGQRLFT